MVVVLPSRGCGHTFTKGPLWSIFNTPRTHSFNSEAPSWREEKQEPGKTEFFSFQLISLAACWEQSGTGRRAADAGLAWPRSARTATSLSGV